MSGRIIELQRAANALINNLWVGTVDANLSHDENWREFDRRYPGVKWLRDELAALQHQQTSLPVEDGWATIDSAPKDGTELLLWCDGPVIGYWWHGRQFRGSDMTEFWTSGPTPCNGYDAGYEELHGVTHWMPLPSSPAQGGRT